MCISKLKAGLDTGAELVSGLSDLADGSRTGGEVVAAVAKTGARGAASVLASTGGAAATSAVLVTAGVTSGLVVVAAPVAAAVIVGAGARYVWQALFD